jgi:hypothetical protein
MLFFQELLALAPQGFEAILSIILATKKPAQEQQTPRQAL